MWFETCLNDHNTIIDKMTDDREQMNDLLLKQPSSNHLFIIGHTTDFLPTLNDLGDSGVTHISDHGGKKLD